MPVTPPLRLRIRCDAPVRPRRELVLYWMTAARRPRSSFALERAAGWARELGKPLVVLEALRAGYLHASDRIHRFVLEGMRQNAEALTRRGVAYHPYVEVAPDEGRGLLEALARHACVVVSDESPAFFLPRMIAAAAARVDVRLETVDGVGLLPLRAVERPYPTAHGFRRLLQRLLPRHLHELPREDPLGAEPLPPPRPLPASIARRWPEADLEALLRPGGLSALPIDHAVGAAPVAGGSAAGRARLEAFVRGALDGYLVSRNQLSPGATSGLSPYLHFGHLSAHEVLAAVAGKEGQMLEKLGRADGRREGFWGLDAPAEAFLDQLVTWRELGQSTAALVPAYQTYGTLPAWALRTLERHRSDPRRPAYDRPTLERGQTHDALWNAAQEQLRREGRMHNYLRMLWGKKLLEWSPSPEEALSTMLELNDRYALDGRDPSSVAGISWVLGRYDRAWGPERPVFGTVRYMSSASTARKLRVRDYLERYAPVTGAGSG